jgi:hypothetical protein
MYFGLNMLMVDPEVEGLTDYATPVTTAENSKSAPGNAISLASGKTLQNHPLQWND